MQETRRFALATLLALLPAAPAWAQFQITSADGKHSLRFGILGQVQAEGLDTADASDISRNLFVRRLRLLIGGQFGERVSFFVETDTANMGKAGADGRKGETTLASLDARFTYSFSTAFKLDTGLLLIPNSHNSGQGATTLFPVDYGPYSFLASAPTGSRGGRDWGALARGYLAGNHLEYRAGVFQGARGADSTAPFRYVGRAVWYPFEAETDFFYSGTSFGKKRVVALGASIDHQDDYNSYGVDAYVDYPVRGGDAVTVQIDLLRYDGGETFTALPRQDCLMVEAGYYFRTPRLGPFVQLARRDFRTGRSPDEASYPAGLAYWDSGHQFNLKLGYSRLTREGDPVRNQWVAQAQLLLF